MNRIVFLNKCKLFYENLVIKILPAIIIMHIVKIFSLSVSAATLPKPTLVIQVIVKYKAVTYIVFLLGPLVSSGVPESLDQIYEYGDWVTLANFHSQLYWIPLSASDLPIEYLS